MRERSGSVALRAHTVDRRQLSVLAAGGGPLPKPARRAITTFDSLVIPDGTPFTLDGGGDANRVAVAPLHESSRLKQVYVRPKYT